MGFSVLWVKGEYMPSFLQSWALCSSGQFGGEEKAGAKSAVWFELLCCPVLMVISDNTLVLGFGIISKMLQMFCGKIMLVWQNLWGFFWAVLFLLNVSVSCGCTWIILRKIILMFSRMWMGWGEENFEAMCFKLIKSLKPDKVLHF